VSQIKRWNFKSFQNVFFSLAASLKNPFVDAKSLPQVLIEASRSNTVVDSRQKKHQELAVFM
jgi:hypothetical protein